MKYLHKFITWIKVKIRKWLFDEEYFMGADYGFHENAIVIYKRNRKTRAITVIGENVDREVYEQEFIARVRQLAQKYNVPETNVIRDFPPSTDRRFF